ncbi:Fic family protein [Kingella kingae]|nr:Fic family protein [Kingella kingae]
MHAFNDGNKRTSIMRAYQIFTDK